MRPQIHWIDTQLTGRLAIMPRPRSGDWLEDEISGWRAEGTDIVVSLLETDEVLELGLEQEAALCKERGMEFFSFPILDRGVPQSMKETFKLCRTMAQHIGGGKAIAVHCRAGIGRSGLIAACILVCSGFEAEAALDIIGKARGLKVPDTEEQRDWITTFQNAENSKTRGD